MATAQTTSPATGSRTTEVVKEHEPVHLRDKDGVLVPVFNYTLEDFDELINLKNQLGRGQMRPRYTLQRLTADGKAVGAFARLSVELETLVSATGWVRVPLRMPEAVLVESPRYKGPTRHFMEFDGGTGGYASWFFGNGEQTHGLRLELLVPIERLSGRQRLKFTAPRSSQSELKLEVPLANAEAALTGSGVLDTTAPRGNGAATALVLRALDGESDLAWWPALRKTVEAAPDLEAVGVLLSKVDGRSVRTEATFTLRSSSGEYRFDQFRVRIPRGANVFPTEQPGVRFQGPNGNGTRVVEVLLDEPTVGPIEVRLSTERPFNIAKKDELVELAGFEIIDALRQWGTIGVEVADEWQIALSEKHPGVRQVETLPETLRLADLVAGFEYSGQPCSLSARVFARETRIAVDPEYEVRVEAGRVYLKARLKYRVPGSKVFFVNVDLQGWETDADRVGPVSLVDQDQLAPQLLTPMRIPLAQPMKGEFELTLEAWKTLPRDAQVVEFHLPHPTAHNLATARVVVVPADNVQLLPRSEGMANLRSYPLPRKYSVPGRQQEPLFYLGDETQGQFAADFRVLPRTLRVSSVASIQIALRDTQVEQKLSYKVLHEPLDRLALEVPRSVVEGKSIEASIGGRPLPLAVQAESAPQPDSPLKIQAALVDDSGKPAERIGAFEVLLRYVVPHEPLTPDASLSLDVPVVIPAEGELIGNTVTVTTAPGVKAASRQGVWSPSPSAIERLDQLAALQLSSPERSAMLPLAVHVESEGPVGTTTVERAWIRSQLASGVREDRAVYRFSTSGNRWELTLPPRIDGANVLATLNGQRIPVTVGSDRKLIVPLAKEAARQSQVLDVSYRFQDREANSWRTDLESPQLPPDVWVRRLYWQVHLPPQQHLVSPPESFLSENAWRWNGFTFGRQPLRSQADLEAWSGAAADPEEPVGNVYLFSALGAVERLELRTARRTWLVFGASLTALCLGLLLIYLPHLRRGLALLIVAAITSLGLLHPEPVLLLLEAGSLGVALVLLAALLERLVAGRRRRVPMRRGASSVLDHRGMLFDKAALAAAGAPSSTRTAAVALSASPEALP